ncbi:hypothetical protein M3Y94_00488000 [Aphelenchoides besseyi]|nr:hypothetical protein M3Y94_00488000 [Aphelenchoides besseyi]
MVIDDKLYGFRCDGTVNTQQLSVFSLGSGLETVHELKTDGLKDGYVYRDSPHTWNANKLLVAKHDWITDTPTVMVFDLPTLKWKDTKLEFDGYIEDLLLIGNSLILRIWKRDEDGISKNWCYRFPFGRLDTLSNSIWHSIGHYSQFHPEFNRWMASKLPSRLRNYLPPWD